MESLTILAYENGSLIFFNLLTVRRLDNGEGRDRGQSWKGSRSKEEEGGEMDLDHAKDGLEGTQRIELDINRSEFVASAMHHSEGKMVIKNIDRPFAMYILNIFILISV